MVNRKLKSLAYLLAYILAIILFCISCGTRKRDARLTAEKKEITRIEKKNISVNVRTEKYADRTTYSPVEPSKEMVLPDGRRGVNVVITDEKINKIEDIEVVDKGEIKEDTKEKTKDKTSNVETKKPNPWLWLGIFASLMGVAYILRSKFLP